MEGYIKKSDSGCKNLKSSKTEHVAEGYKSAMAVSEIIASNQVQLFSRMIVLRSILNSVDSAFEEWPRDLSKAVQTRLGRMLRGGRKKVVISSVKNPLIKLVRRNSKDELIQLKETL
ncbi:hypothetical protein TCON_2352 [Astathelohania contejeani]|uniref:Uncharacterized protein n=1 Tax=Astathelohania contejeani TaxID=164912 RepID=A0ABQ7HW96_9MICR|nr:hypothetical protein TCON_2352 [Thelohania contejeani]